jgi:hypothetical protein
MATTNFHKVQLKTVPPHGGNVSKIEIIIHRKTYLNKYSKESWSCVVIFHYNRLKSLKIPKE